MVSAIQAICLDHASTTPVDRRVVRAMRGLFGNPHAKSHRIGRDAARLVEEARDEVAQLIGAAADEIVFTSGATESVNLALRGTGRPHLVTLATEHACVLETAQALAHSGTRVTVLPVDAQGAVDPAAVEAALSDGPALLSVTAANNETGIVPPLPALGRIAAERGALLHVDAAQAAGRLPLDVAALGADLLTLSGHKMGGPAGIGALYVRRGVALRPTLTGGGQERGLRPGTLPLPLVVGFGRAARIARREQPANGPRLAYLAERFTGRLKPACPTLRIVAATAERAPHIAMLELPGIDASALLDAVPGVALSTGAACGSGRSGPSHVLTAMGFSAERAATCIRASFGVATTEEEVDQAAKLLGEALLSAPDRPA